MAKAGVAGTARAAATIAPVISFLNYLTSCGVQSVIPCPVIRIQKRLGLQQGGEGGLRHRCRTQKTDGVGYGPPLLSRQGSSGPSRVPGNEGDAGHAPSLVTESGRLDLNQRPFGPQPSGVRRLSVSERPSFPMCPGPWTIWTDRTLHRVPKRYHGGLTIGHAVRRAPHDRRLLSREGVAQRVLARGAPTRTDVSLAVGETSTNARRGQPASHSSSHF
jgi:hypothetical protein